MCICCMLQSTQQSYQACEQHVALTLTVCYPGVGVSPKSQCKVLLMLNVRSKNYVKAVVHISLPPR